MSWNYRIFLCRHRAKDGYVEKWLEIKEAYYANKGDRMPNGWTERGAGVHGENISDVLEMMYVSLTKPVIDEETKTEIGSHTQVAARLKEEMERENEEFIKQPRPAVSRAAQRSAPKKRKS